MGVLIRKQKVVENEKRLYYLYIIKSSKIWAIVRI